MKQVSKEWFKKDALVIAKELLGKVIECNGCKGMIIETEVYKDDPASHGYKITPRSQIMLSYGKVYVYLIYGMYHCLNFTAGKEVGAVLIRSVEPFGKLDTSGPGKLCRAMNIDKSLNGTEINDKIKVFHHKKFRDIGTSSRIGISKGKELEWRFFKK